MTRVTLEVVNDFPRLQNQVTRYNTVEADISIKRD